MLVVRLEDTMHGFFSVEWHALLYTALSNFANMHTTVCINTLKTPLNNSFYFDTQKVPKDPCDDAFEYLLGQLGTNDVPSWGIQESPPGSTVPGPVRCISPGPVWLGSAPRN